MNQSVYVSGVGMTRFGELWDEDLVSLGCTAGQEALADSGIAAQAIDLTLVANMGAQLSSGQGHLGALFVDKLGVAGSGMRIEGACASGGLAIELAHSLISSGMYKNILVLGVEKMTDLGTPQIGSMLGGAASFADETVYGASFPALYAMMAQEHMRKYATTRDDLAAIAVKNHAYGALNPKAQYQNQITTSTVLGASMVASPLGLFDCSPITDGAAAVVLSRDKKGAKSKIVASQIAHDKMALHDRRDLCSLQSTKKAATAAYKAAGISARDISVAELHDCFTIAELMAYEDLGFVAKGKGASFARKPAFAVNTSGGLKACGHPVGATGVKQIVELSQQFAGRADKRQLTDPLKFGLAHNVGGSGATAIVTVVTHA